MFVDAFVPHDGETVIGLAGGPPPGPVTIGQDWLVPPAPRDYDDPDEAAFADARRSPQPLRCFTEPVHLGRPLEAFPFTRTYVKATADRPDAPAAGVFWAAADRARQSPAWRYREIATNHMIPSNRPDELAALLLELTRDDAGACRPPTARRAEGSAAGRPAPSSWSPTAWRPAAAPSSAPASPSSVGAAVVGGTVVVVVDVVVV